MHYNSYLKVRCGSRRRAFKLRTSWSTTQFVAHLPDRSPTRGTRVADWLIFTDSHTTTGISRSGCVWKCIKGAYRPIHPSIHPSTHEHLTHSSSEQIRLRTPTDSSKREKNDYITCPEPLRRNLVIILEITAFDHPPQTLAILSTVTHTA